MTDEAIEVITSVFTDLWTIFTNVKVPGTNMNFANLWVGVLFAWAIVKLIEKILDITGDGLTNDYSSKRKFYSDRDMDWRY